MYILLKEMDKKKGEYHDQGAVLLIPLHPSSYLFLSQLEYAGAREEALLFPSLREKTERDEG